MTTVFSACGKNTGKADSNMAPAEKIQVRFMTSWTATSTAGPFFESIKQRIEEELGDEIELLVEEVPGGGNEIEEKLTVMIHAGTMPDLCTCKTIETLKAAADANLIIDAKPYIEKDKEWLASLDSDTNAAFNPYPGKWYGVLAARRLVGYFYNQEIFDAANITPAKTWDEFFSNCDKIKAAGYIPIALGGGEGGWLTNTILLPLVATHSKQGFDFINQKYPTEFDNEPFIYGLTQIKYLYKNYATPDMAGNLYVQSAPYFLRGEAGIIGNGTWMISSFKDEEQAVEGLYDKVHFSLFPEDSCVLDLADPFLLGVRDEDGIAATLKVLKCFTDKEGQYRRLLLNQSTPVDTTIDVNTVEGLDPLLVEAMNKSKDIKVTIQGPWMVFPGSLWETLSREYASLVYDLTTPEEMAINLQKAAEAQAEQDK